jgi:uncharacterized membrane protein
MTEQTEDSARQDSVKQDSATENSATEVREPQDRAAQGRASEDSASEDSATEDSRPDAGQSADEVEFISAERLIFFTDAVVAIAMTLLAFGLRIPHFTTDMSDKAALEALWDPYRLGYLAFLISFVVIGSHWRTHHRLFRDVSRLDTRIITLNMVWLLMIVIMPFATRLLSGGNGFPIVFGLYALIQVITILTALLMSRHIRAGHLLRPGAAEARPTDDDATALTFAVMFAISIPVAFQTSWAFAIWVAAAPVARIVRRLRHRV